MALLQIAEPGQSPLPHETRYAIGIDLGTTNSLVASVRQGMSHVMNDAEGRALVPSVVRYQEDGSVLVGYDALKAIAKDPKNTIASVKRLMGRSLTDIAHRENLPLDLVDNPGMVCVKTRQGVKTPVEVSADILRVLNERAQQTLKQDIVGAVITVPAYFDDAQRQATKDAARLAGLNVLRLLNEPTAAAVAYGLDNASEGVYAVYDLGGGTFDISILRLTRGVFEVLATGGDSALGGDDFDRRIYCWVLDQAKLKSPPTVEDTALLLLRSREAKEYLSTHPEAPITARLASGEIIDVTIDMATFAEISQTLVSKTLQPVKKTLRDAGLRPEDIQGVVMVGGATRIPLIQRAVGEFFKQEPLNNLDPDKVVALGAAIQANLLAGNRAPGEDWLLLDVIPLSLGLETMGGLVEKVIPRNSTLPVARAQEFTTYRDGQTAMMVHVVQGERELVDDCRSLARFELRGIPPMVAGAARIRVTFQVDADGLLSVTAREQTTGVESHVEVKPSYGLSDDQITGMLKASVDHARDDAQTRALKETQVDAQRLIEAVRSALAEDRHLLNEQEFQLIESGIVKLQTASLSGNRRKITIAMDDLDADCKEFAGRRMNQAVNRALAGKSIDSVEETMKELHQTANAPVKDPK